MFVSILSVLFRTLCGGLILLFAGSLDAVAAPQSLLVVGDSLTAGYGLPQGHAFPSVLEERLSKMGMEVRVRNGGVSGDTTAGGRARLDWILQPRPDAVILELGANDALRGQPPKSTYQNLKAMIATLQKENIPVLLAGMKAPRNYGEEYAAKFDAIYPKLAEETGVQLYPFFMAGVITRPELLQADGLHPTKEGVSVIVDHILPHVKALLKQAESLPQKSQ